MGEINKILRVKSLGNVNIIGELIKQDLITHNVILKCFALLMDTESQNDERLQYLCELLVTTGKELEEKNVNLNPVFCYISDVLNNKIGQISEGSRDMLLEVINLRNNNWITAYNESNVIDLDEIKAVEPKRSTYNIVKNETCNSGTSSVSQDATLLSGSTSTLLNFVTPYCSRTTFEIRYLKEIIEHKNEIIAELREHIKLLKEKISDKTKLKEPSHDKCI